MVVLAQVHRIGKHFESKLRPSKLLVVLAYNSPVFAVSLRSQSSQLVFVASIRGQSSIGLKIANELNK